MRKTLASVRLGTEHGLGAEHGFTVIEVLVAATILVSALFGSFLMLDISSRTARVDAGREAATNLVRNVNEDVRSLPYASITTATLPGTLQAMPGLANTSGGGSWQVTRRGFIYTLTVTETDLSAIASQTAQQKQVTTTASWNTGNGITHTVRATITISSGGQLVALPATNLQWANPPGSGWSGTVTQPVIQSNTVPPMTFSVVTPLNVSGVRWTLNGAIQSWTAAVTATSGSTETWTVNAPGWTISGLPNATYTLGATAQNGTVSGTPITIQVKIMTNPPAAVTFIGAGYDTHLYNGTTAIPQAVVLDWTGSNAGEPNIVGYQISRTPYGGSTATVICSSRLTASTATTGYPTSCGQNGATVWCETPWRCIDLSAAAPAQNNATYTVQPLYYNAANVLTAGAPVSVTPLGLAYTLAPTTANSGNSATCYRMTPSARDLSTTYSVGTTTSTWSGTQAVFCAPAATSSQTVVLGGTATLYFALSPTYATCSVTGYLSKDGSGWITSAATSIRPSGATTVSFGTGSQISFVAGDQINFGAYWSCSNSESATLEYGSTTSDSVLSMSQAPVQVPYPPTGFSVTTNGDGSGTLQWTAPSGGPTVSGYEIYRGGYGYVNRGYFDDTAHLCSGSACTWTDKSRSTSQTYYLAAVGNTQMAGDEAESDPKTVTASG